MEKRFHLFAALTCKTFFHSKINVISSIYYANTDIISLKDIGVFQVTVSQDSRGNYKVLIQALRRKRERGRVVEVAGPYCL